MNPTVSNTTTLSELMSLLDPATVQLLADRLHAIAAQKTDHDKAQLLFDFIDTSLIAEEEERESGDRKFVLAPEFENIFAAD